MTAIINALDNFTSTQIGENGHVEYGWSNSIKEKIIQFSFQLVRTNEIGIKNLQLILKDILNSLKFNIEQSSLVEKEVSIHLLSILYRLIGHTRDIIDGKGEYTLTYMMIYNWYEFFPNLAFFAIKCLVDLGDKSIHQYGSWKDIKYFCEYCKNSGCSLDHPLIQYSIKLLNEKLREDETKLENPSEISLVSKWIPREKSSFGWLYEKLASDYFSEYLSKIKTFEQKKRAILKCKTEYRQLLSKINKIIDTLQIKQCGQNWSKINFDRVTSISLSKQKKAFLNIDKCGQVRFPENFDRIECANNFKARIKKAVSGEVEMKGKRIGMADFTKQALEVCSNEEVDLINSQWRDNSSQNHALGKMIAMVDVSGSMQGDPLHVAIALGIRISEKSILGKRVMTFSSNPSWVNLEPYTDFVSQVRFLKKSDWGQNTNFYAAFNMILDAIIQNKMDPSEVQDMVLVILSDMQMDASDSCDKKKLYEEINEKYRIAGNRLYKKPFIPPHIIFWNLRSTNGFPCLSYSPNCSMMSGFNPTLLNNFCDLGLEALQSYNPWSVLERMLENERYLIMSKRLEEEIN
jgi:Mg-chelatase subunit ChlD